MKILFLDQTAELGGAELSLFSEVTNLPHQATVLLFEDGPFRKMLDAAGVTVEIVQASAGAMTVRREAGILALLLALPAVIRLVRAVAAAARAHDLIYANSQKAFVVGVFASALSGRRLVWRLRDVLAAAHFSATLRRLAVGLANWKASSVIANSAATGAAFVSVGGNAAKVSIAYPGIAEAPFNGISAEAVAAIRAELGAGGTQLIGAAGARLIGAAGARLIGVFGRLSPWKGQAVFIDAIAKLPDAIGVIVGAPLFGHEAYAAELEEKVISLQCTNRIRFLGFRQDIPLLMSAMDVVVHSSIAPEPFGRVVVEGMLAGRPVVASAAGGVLEIIEHGKTGWLYEPGNPDALAATLQTVLQDKANSTAIAGAGQHHARNTFTVAATMRQIEAALSKC